MRLVNIVFLFSFFLPLSLFARYKTKNGLAHRSRNRATPTHPRRQIPHARRLLDKKVASAALLSREISNPSVGESRENEKKMLPPSSSPPAAASADHAAAVSFGNPEALALSALRFRARQASATFLARSIDDSLVGGAGEMEEEDVEEADAGGGATTAARTTVATTKARTACSPMTTASD